MEQPPKFKRIFLNLADVTVTSLKVFPELGDVVINLVEVNLKLGVVNPGIRGCSYKTHKRRCRIGGCYLPPYGGCDKIRRVHKLRIDSSRIGGNYRNLH